MPEELRLHVAPSGQACLTSWVTYCSSHPVHQLIHSDAAFHFDPPGGLKDHRFCMLGLMFALQRQKWKNQAFKMLNLVLSLLDENPIPTYEQ